MDEKQRPSRPDSESEHPTTSLASQSTKSLSTPEPLAGKTLAHFELLEEIGRGGMGVVYRALDTRLRREVALKTIASSAGQNVLRFRREAEAIARLRHPGIVTIHETGETAGTHYIAMDLLHGTTLSKELEKGPLPVREGVEILRDVARAIQYAHEQGVVHRDLKPQNLMLERDRVVVLDFGLARLEGGEGLTKSDTAIGTPAYMPPEQAGPHRDSVDERSDVYALGATLFHVLTGRPPFLGETAIQILAAVLTKEPDSLRLLAPDVPEDLEAICLRALEKDPSRRYPSAAAFAQDLERFLSGKKVGRPRSVPWEVVAGVLALVVVILVALLASPLLEKTRAGSSSSQESPNPRKGVDGNAARLDAKRWVLENNAFGPECDLVRDYARFLDEHLKKDAGSLLGVDLLKTGSAAYVGVLNDRLVVVPLAPEEAAGFKIGPLTAVTIASEAEARRVEAVVLLERLAFKTPAPWVLGKPIEGTVSCRVLERLEKATYALRLRAPIGPDRSPMSFYSYLDEVGTPVDLSASQPGKPAALAFRFDAESWLPGTRIVFLDLCRVDGASTVEILSESLPLVVTVTKP